MALSRLTRAVQTAALLSLLWDAACTPSPTGCPGYFTYESHAFVNESACSGCANGTITESFQAGVSNASDCARKCDLSASGAVSFVFAPNGPHANGCWCKFKTLNPTSLGPTTTGPTTCPTTCGPTTASPSSHNPTTCGPSSTSPTSSSPSTLSPSTQSPSTTGPTTTSPNTASPSSSPSSQNPTTRNPTTCPTSTGPVTQVPTTNGPTTTGPTTYGPTTRGPTTCEPSASPVTFHPSHTPTTCGPTTCGPTTRGPTTCGPTTCGPTTAHPTMCPTSTHPSQTPTTCGPTTCGPTSCGPTTCGPTTSAPTTCGPTTHGPTTCGPTTYGPTTANPSQTPTTANPSQTPTTGNPTSHGPTTKNPTTCGPTSRNPTTANPSQTPTTANPSQTPTTCGPTTCGPTTLGPTTCGPTTYGPTTANPSQTPTTANPSQTPTTGNPTSHGPTTLGPTTCGPTTCGPTTANPSRSPSTANPSQTPTTGNPTSPQPSISPTSDSPSKSPITRWPTYTFNPTRSPRTNQPTQTPVTVQPSQTPTTASPFIPNRVTGVSIHSSSPTEGAHPASNMVDGSSVTHASFAGAAPWWAVVDLTASNLKITGFEMEPDGSAQSPKLFRIEHSSDPNAGPWTISLETTVPAAWNTHMKFALTNPATERYWRLYIASSHDETGPTIRQILFNEPVTGSPTTHSPTSRSPTSWGPSTCGPTTCGPTTCGPTTCGPTTSFNPTTCGPTTLGPTTRSPTTCNPMAVGGMDAMENCLCPYDRVTHMVLPPPLTSATYYVTGVFSVIRRCITTTPTTCGPTTATPTSLTPTQAPTTTCLPPNLDSAVLGTSAGYFIVSFSADTNQAEMGGLEPNTNCSMILHANTTLKLGVGPSCEWETASSLRVTFGSSASIQEQDNVRVRGDVVKRSANCTVFLEESSTPLAFPESQSLPSTTAIITAPSSSGSCQALSVSGAQSQGAASRSLTYKWDLAAVESAGSGSVGPQSAIESLKTTVKSVTSAEFSLNVSSINASAVYTFGLQVTNWLNSTSNRVEWAVTKLASPVPVVTIDGSETRSVSVHETVTISTSLSPPTGPSAACVAGREVEYQWTSSTNHTHLVSSSLNAKTLFIAPQRLTAGEKYQFTVRSRYNGVSDAEAVSESNVTLVASPSSPIAVVTRCNRRVTHGDPNLEYDINGGHSYDPDHPNTGSTNLDFNWTCIRTQSGDPCVFNQTNLTAVTGATLTLQSFDLQATNNSGVDNAYRFTVTVTHKSTGLTSQTQCELTTRADSVAEVWVEAPAVRAASGQVVLRSNTSLSSTDVAQYQWRCELLDGSACGLNLSSSALVLTSSSSSTLVLNTALLRGGVTYRFLIVLSPATEAELTRVGEARPQADTLVTAGVAFVEVKVPAAPSSGVCEAVPAVGEAYTTKIKLKCRDWTGGSNIQYAFRLISGQTLRTGTPNPELEWVFPGDGSDSTTQYNATVIASITNAEGGATESAIVVQILTPTLTAEETSALAAASTDAASAAAASGDLSGATSAVMNSLALLLGSPDAATRQALVDAAVAAALNAPSTTDSLAQKASLLGLVTGGGTTGASVSTNAANQTVHVLGLLINEMDKQPFLDYTEAFGDSVVGAISNVVNTSATSGAALSTAVGNALSSLGQAIGSTVSAGQAPVTASSPGLDLSVQLSDIASATEPLQIQHGNTKSSNSETVVVPLSALSAVSSALSIFVSSGSYFPPNPNVTTKTGLTTLEFRSAGGDLVTVTNVTAGINISIALRKQGEDANDFGDVCQFWNASLANWDTSGCNGYLDNNVSIFTCVCEHLTAFQGAQQALPQTITLSAQDIRNLTLSNLMKNPFTLIALLTVFSIYVIIVVTSKRLRGERVCWWEPKRPVHEDAESVRDFLTQWYFQIPVEIKVKGRVVRGGRLNRKFNSSFRNVTGRPSWLKKKHGHSDTKLTFNLDGIDRVTPDALTGPHHTASNAGGCVCCGVYCFGARKGELDPRRDKRFVAQQKRKAQCVRKMRKILVKVGPEPESKGPAPAPRNRESCGGRTYRLWKFFLKRGHSWVSVFRHARMDPYTSQWRANVLLQSLLLVLCVNGFFYGVKQNTMGVVAIGFLSALMVAVCGYALVKLAKRIGYLDWEVRTCELRDHMCEPLVAISAQSKSAMGTPPAWASSRRRLSGGKLGSTSIVATKDSSIAIDGIESSASITTPNVPTGSLLMMNPSQSVASVRRRAKAYRIMAWLVFLVLVAGSSFTILVLGIKFDLDDGNDRARGINVEESRSFKWIASVLVSETFRSILLSPARILCQSALLVCLIKSTKFIAVFMLNSLVDNDDLTQIKAYDVFMRCVSGYRLKPESIKRLTALVKAARDARVRYFIDDSDSSDSEDDASVSRWKRRVGRRRELVKQGSLSAADFNLLNSIDRIRKTSQSMRKGNSSRWSQRARREGSLGGGVGIQNMDYGSHAGGGSLSLSFRARGSFMKNRPTLSALASPIQGEAPAKPLIPIRTKAFRAGTSTHSLSRGGSMLVSAESVVPPSIELQTIGGVSDAGDAKGGDEKLTDESLQRQRKPTQEQSLLRQVAFLQGEVEFLNTIGRVRVRIALPKGAWRKVYFSALRCGRKGGTGGLVVIYGVCSSVQKAIKRALEEHRVCGEPGVHCLVGIERITVSDGPEQPRFSILSDNGEHAIEFELRDGTSVERDRWVAVLRAANQGTQSSDGEQSQGHDSNDAKQESKESEAPVIAV